MNEAELHNAFLATLGGAHTAMFDYISLMFAFLVMSYLAAHRLPAFLASIVLLLFALISGLLIFQVFLYRNEAVAIASFLIEAKESGSLDLPWYGTNPQWAPRVVSFFTVAITAGGFLTCLAFFFYQRKSAKVDIEP